MSGLRAGCIRPPKERLCSSSRAAGREQRGGILGGAASHLARDEGLDEQQLGLDGRHVDTGGLEIGDGKPWLDCEEYEKQRWIYRRDSFEHATRDASQRQRSNGAMAAALHSSRS